MHFCGLELRTPVMNASGVMSDCPRILKEWELAGAGAVTTKSILIEGKKSNEFSWTRPAYDRKLNRFRGTRRCPELIMIRGKDYTINSMGLPNQDPREMHPCHDAAWWREQLERVKFSVPVNASVATAWGRLEDYGKIVKIMEPVVDMFEINVSCPNTDHRIIGHDLDSMAALIDIIETSKPLGFKLPCYALEGTEMKYILEPDEIGRYYLDDFVTVDIPTKIDVEKLREIIELLETRGIDFVTSINTLPVSHPVLSRPVGGISGRPIHEIAVEQARVISKHSDIDIIGVGGIMNAKDAMDFLRMKNVKAIQLGSGVFQTDLPHLFVREILEGCT